VTEENTLVASKVALEIKRETTLELGEEPRWRMSGEILCT